MTIGFIKGTVANFASLLVILCIMIYFSWKSQKGEKFYIRPPASVAALPEIVGRCAEMNRPMHYTYGKWGLLSCWTPIGTVTNYSSLLICERAARLAARLGVNLIATVCKAESYLITYEIIKAAYLGESAPEKEVDVRYLSSFTLSYASGVLGILHRENVAGNICVGAMGEETLLFAESGVRVGAMQILGTVHLEPFSFMCSDYVLFGEDIIATAACLSEDPVLVNGLVSSTYVKYLVIALVSLASILLTLGNDALLNILKL